jgi:hypothetical protein
LSERVGNGFNKESHKAELKHNVAFANTVLASFCKYHVNWSLTNKKKIPNFYFLNCEEIWPCKEKIL